MLIRCQAGVNRSGLVTALTLMLAGYDATDAIALMRAQRSPAVLSNTHFVEWLVSQAAVMLTSSTSSDPVAA